MNNILAKKYLKKYQNSMTVLYWVSAFLLVYIVLTSRYIETKITKAILILLSALFYLIVLYFSSKELTETDIVIEKLKVGKQNEN